jgi:Ca2+-dependent lipid-binding protein
MGKKGKPEVQDAWPAGKGKLIIQLLKATDLISKDRNGKSDPFVRVETQGKVRFKTETHKKTLNPEFTNKDVVFLTSPEHLRPEDELVLEIRDW